MPARQSDGMIMQDPTILRALTDVPTAVGLSARLAVARLRQRGIDPVPLLMASDLSEEAVAGHKRISARAQADFRGLVSRAIKDDFLGLNLAADFDLRETGMLY